ncbi:helix-turn-helix transcriptional regulator [Amycolatopsis albispora]|uniref:DNA-binding transcriptional regulator n=1 Tax=Amycolatopsis albispora TaxID=1804986 RepID=A0A344L3L6_9PSEU|nr:YafY family protein [Amycolatopsis albispora]AXB42640.1 DNA-binding transcriptional regulator [Amycolatopsis albispora]
MLETSARLLRLLSLLQTTREWTGPQLAARLGVSTRTVRKDVERLRELGYPVHAQPGAAGGYQLGAGARMPPLLLDDEEAVAVVVGLRTAAGGLEESSLRALTKLEHVLPSRLRHRVTTLQAATVAAPDQRPPVDPAVLTTIAAACRDHERLRFDYQRHDGTTTRRDVEPHRLVHAHRRWYLVGWDTARGDWRTFRVDRTALRTPNGPRFTPREPPHDDLAAYVTEGLTSAFRKIRATVRLHGPADRFTEHLADWGAVEPVDQHTCLLHTAGDSHEMLAFYLGLLDTDFDVLDPPELAGHLHHLGRRFLRATGNPG